MSDSYYSRDYPRDSYYSRDYYCHSLVIIARFPLDVYEIIIDFTATFGGSRRHGAKQSGSRVLFISRFVGVDYELSALFEKHRMSTANCSKSALFSVKWIFH